MKDLLVLFLGAPGAGKGTQSAVISKDLEMSHLSSGDLFRSAVARGDELANTLKSYMDAGQLVPDEITTRMVLFHMNNEGIRRAILDGFPRTITQAESLDKALEADGRKLDAVILIDVPDEELIKRLASRWICKVCQKPYTYVDGPNGALCTCGGELYQRSDDNKETVMNRLVVYHQNTAPLVDYYEKKGNLIRINGTGDVDDITAAIKDALKAF